MGSLHWNGQVTLKCVCCCFCFLFYVVIVLWRIISKPFCRCIWFGNLLNFSISFWSPSRTGHYRLCHFICFWSFDSSSKVPPHCIGSEKGEKMKEWNIFFHQNKKLFQVASHSQHHRHTISSKCPCLQTVSHKNIVDMCFLNKQDSTMAIKSVVDKGVQWL
jgi:hypothetical protein